MTDSINNAASSSRTAAAGLIPHEERPLKAPAGTENFVRQSVEPTCRQRSESRRGSIVCNSGDYPKGTYHQNHVLIEVD